MKKTSTFLFAAIVSLGSLASAFAQGVTDKEIYVGQVASMSGAASYFGKGLNAGVQSYFNAVNAAGGINGRTLRLIARDDADEPERAAKAASSLLTEDGVFAFIGTSGAMTASAMIPVLVEAKVPLVGVSSGASFLRSKGGRYLFHVRASYEDEAEKIATQVATVSSLNRVVVVYQDDPSGQSGYEAFRTVLQKKGVTNVLAVKLPRDGSGIQGAVSEVMKHDPEAIFQAGAKKPLADFVRMAQASGYRRTFYSLSGVGPKLLADELGRTGVGSVAIAQVVPSPYSAVTPLAREYQADMRASGVNDFDYLSFEGYVIAKVFVEGLRNAGRSLSREAFINGLEQIKSSPFDRSKFEYGPKDHVGSSFVETTVIFEGGKFLK